MSTLPLNSLLPPEQKESENPFEAFMALRLDYTIQILITGSTVAVHFVDRNHATVGK